VTAADGTAPAGDLIRLAKHWATFHNEEPYLLFALDGWSTAYGLPLQPILSRRGMEARTQIRRRCTGQLAWGAFGSDLIRGRSRAWHPWMDIARSNTPGAALIDAPVLIQHGDRDELIPIESSQTRLRTLCAHGSQAELRMYAGADHEILDPAFPDAISWIVDTVRGVSRIGSGDA